MTTPYSMEIEAPINQVFDWVDDDEKIKQWMDGLEGTTYPDGRDRENPVGTRFKQSIREGGRVTEYDGEVTAYDKPNHLAVRIGNQQFTIDVDYRFSRMDDDRTRLDFSADTAYHSTLARLMGSLFGWYTNRILNSQMESLKGHAEGESTASETVSA